MVVIRRLIVNRVAEVIQTLRPLMMARVPAAALTEILTFVVLQVFLVVVAPVAVRGLIGSLFGISILSKTVFRWLPVRGML